MNWLTDKVALVTGAGSGIGKAVTRRYVDEGARVVAFDISEARLRTLGDEIGANVTTIHGDVRSADDYRRAVAHAVATFGKLDIFVGNAGVWDARRRLVDLSDDELARGFDEVFAINVKGYLLGAKATHQELARNKGAIILTLSTSSFYTGGGGSIYVAAKHATHGLLRALAHELAPDVRVNGVAPSGTATAMVSSAGLTTLPSDPAATDTRPRKRNLLNIAVEAEDHVGAYVLLASRYARAMTGTVIASDAGRGVNP